MISWFFRLIGLSPRVAPERRRSLAERLKDPTSEESMIMARAQAALDRHRQREEAIQKHQAEVKVEKAEAQAQRQEHQSEIAESTISLNRTRRKTDEIRKARLRERNPFNVTDLAREEARRRRENRG